MTKRTEPPDDFDFDREYEDAVDPAWKAALDLNKENAPRRNLYNACVALRGHPALAGKLGYDEFNGCTVARGPLPWDDRPNRLWGAMDDLAITEWLQTPEIGVLVTSNVAREAVERVAYENRFHPVVAWLESLKWDGEERLRSWLTTYLGVPRSPLTGAIGRAFLISAVARVMRPGCKADHILILEGPQGILKSTALRTLVGDEWFADQIADLGTKDSCQDLRGKWLIELSELSAIRPGEVERVKAYVTRQTDRYRPSYGRRSGDVPRQTVFAGTTNDREYLSDATGGRRFWPVTCAKPDVEAIARDRDQLWAEAVAAYHEGERWWLDDDELRKAAEAEQELRRVEDPWEAIIAAWLDNPTRLDDHNVRFPLKLEKDRVTVDQILAHAIAKPTERQGKADQMRVGRILTRLGWKKTRVGAVRFWERKVGASETPAGPEGGSLDEVGAPGGSTENRGESALQGSAPTMTTCSARTYEGGRDPVNPGSEKGSQGGQGGSFPPSEPVSDAPTSNGEATAPTPTNGEAARERIGACIYCRDAAYADDAKTTQAGGVLHHRCAGLGHWP